VTCTPCTPQQADIPQVSYGHFEAVRKQDNVLVQLQRDISNGAPSVHLYVNSTYYGEYLIPAEITLDLVAHTEQRLVLETWMGSVRQTYKMIPIAKFCAEVWDGYIVN